MGTLGIFVDRQTLSHSRKLGAVMRFRDAAEALGHRSYFIFPVEMRKIAKTSALLIRGRTDPLNATYVAARWASLHGIPVIDDATAIRICSDKVNMYMHLQKAGVPIPETWYLGRRDIEAGEEGIIGQLHFPLVLKEPSTSFSNRVKVAHDRRELMRIATSYLKLSHLIVVQEHVESEEDWRIGILDGEVLFASRYVEIESEEVRPIEEEEVPYYGVEVLPLDRVPERALRLAVRAACAIGEGLYSVDIKERGGKLFVIEVNDNPSLENGEEEHYPDVYERIVARLMKA